MQIMKNIFIILLTFILIIPSSVFASTEKAILAGGCFWCLEHDLEIIPGVISVESGYTGGDIIDPTYQNHKGHQEAVLVTFDPDKISFKKLLRSYWRNIDPFDGSGQFCDRGESYIPVIFAMGDEQIHQAIDSSDSAAKELSMPKLDIKVQIKKAKKFWLAEDYHQDFALKNKLKYKFYRSSCGRDRRLNNIWGLRMKSDVNWIVGKSNSDL